MSCYRDGRYPSNSVGYCSGVEVFLGAGRRWVYSSRLITNLGSMLADLISGSVGKPDLSQCVYNCGVVSMTENLVAHQMVVDREQRSALKQQRPVVLWFTGLSGAGKSTIANALEQALLENNRHTYLLDGDNMRLGLCSDLGFNDHDRAENIRRIAEVGKLFVDAGLIVVSAFISPFRLDRALARKVIGDEFFVEVYISTPLPECERRDPKGLYGKARSGMIKNFTGIDSLYEPPLNPDITINTLEEDVSVSVEKIMQYLVGRIER